MAAKMPLFLPQATEAMRRHFYSFVTVVAAVLFPLSFVHVAIGQSIAATPNTQLAHLLQLTVLDQASGQPIAGAQIEFDAEPTNGRTTTDARGQATIDFSSSQWPWLSVQHSHYVGKEIRWHQGRESETPPTAYTVRLEPGTTIGGKVVDDAGKPITGAHVVVWLEGNKLPDPCESVYVSDEGVKTSADGMWEMDDIPNQYKSLQIGAWDYQHLEKEFFPLQEFSPFSALRDHSAVFALKRGVAITGTVFGPDGKPLMDAKVAFGTDRIVSNDIPELKTGADGKFSMAAQPGMMVTLTVRAEGCAPQMQRSLLGRSPIKLDFHLARGNTISGMVTDAAGRPLPLAYIWFDTWRGSRTLRHTERTDQSGQFAWHDAPADIVYADVEVGGYTRKSSVAMTAGEPLHIALQKQLLVTGSVVDSQTHQPIPSFRIIHGAWFDDQQPISWIPANGDETGSGGTFSFSPEFPYPAHVVRIEADGYLPADSGTFTDAQGQVKLEFQLKKGSDLVVHCMTADGKPATGATAVLVEPGQMLQIVDGQMVYSSALRQVTVAADGSVRFPPIASDFTIAVFGDAGIGQERAAKIQGDKAITLQPWARLTGTLHIGNRPGAAETMQVEPKDAISFDATQLKQPQIRLQSQTKTDSAGCFVFDHVAPGVVYVSRQIIQPMGATWAEMPAQTQTVTLAPGQSAEVTLGGKGRLVTGRVQIPNELAQRNDWVFETATADSAGQPPKLPMPADVKAGTAQQQSQWYKAFYASDAGKTYENAVRDFSLNRVSYPVQIAQDGSFRIDDVGAGSYTIGFNINQPSGGTTCGPGDNIARGQDTFTVPPMPDGRTDEPLELPSVELEMVKSVAVGEIAPDFSVKTLDGNAVALSQYRGKYVLLDFWATWCGPCVASTPYLKATFNAFGKNSQFAMVSLSLDAKAADAQQYARKNQLTWQQVFLPGQWNAQTVKAYGVRGIPSIWLIGPDGRVMAKDLRGDGIKLAVASALNGSPTP
jgi:protocatechuate 3,4-dioxygenase beta subunit/peroxiredoxin